MTSINEEESSSDELGDRSNETFWQEPMLAERRV